MRKIAILIAFVSASWASLASAQKVIDESEDVRVKQGHFSIGIGGGFGFAKESDADDSGISAGGFIEPGYTLMLDPWTIGEFSIEVSSAKADFKDNGEKATVSLNYMALLQAGYGYSLGDNLFAIFKIGAGPTSADFEIDDIESDDSSIGVAIRGSAGLRMLAGQSIDFTAGLRATYITVDFEMEAGPDASAHMMLSELFVSARIKI